MSSSLDDNCLQSSLVYICKAATLVTPTTSDKTFKDRFYYYKNPLRYESKGNQTELSNFALENKHENTEASLEWKILDKAKSYKTRSGKYMVCLTEKQQILFSKLNLLNPCSKLVTKCQHENKILLKYITIKIFCDSLPTGDNYFRIMQLIKSKFDTPN